MKLYFNETKPIENITAINFLTKDFIETLCCNIANKKTSLDQNLKTTGLQTLDLGKIS